MIDVLDGTAALAIADELGTVFAAAFGPEEDTERFTTETLPAHSTRDAFRLVTARTPRPAGVPGPAAGAGSLDVAGVMGGSGPLVGFAYGFTGERGQWWPDRVVEAVGPELAAEWVGGHFEVVELAVHPDAQRRGLGAALMTELLRDLPHRRALLGTDVDDGPAPRLYRRLGWQLLYPDLGWGSALYGLDRGVPRDG
ncbi:N-acetyltransferase [Kribbella sp.]|uniref:GNAT family N-acetyltransferase n=1 Tax=Kribbella sp. TaxID=1871183 RepID=UPI002D547813|nr:N-acetyltransferase [Kribbella sp.]HZX06197.1 N-acetyltransferase [Kribbella sp.]